MRTTRRKSPPDPLDIRYTPTARDRAAFRALQQFAVAEGDAPALAKRANGAVMFTTPLISSPYGIGEDADERREVQRQLRAWFEQLHKGRGATLVVEEDIKGFRLSYSLIGPRVPPVMTWGWNVGALGRFWIDVAELMVRVGPALRRCAQCQAIFLRSKRQVYCTPRCSQVARSAKWYRAHRQAVQSKRRDTYVAEVRRKHPRAKVASRTTH